ncbi:uncharacterized protein si:dkey-181m9.8 isoform X1 [Brienomyrus brachyistius]|uniref:uncharacterized protein si:dkey-181m9.8 isoform X1 n=1 Tax=Brienomyrus brachyistius TaxID=42636 RepID=UPI0020B1DACC|nr:uncharacterized protein si:dkey-181m9.8 isoform X1 [Brienomyrus brachyistius]
MSLLSADLEALAECRYRYPTEAALDIRAVTALYHDLHLYVEYYYYANKEKKQLVNLSGTIPVLYEGAVYNIPVSVWLHETHPQNPPKCFVRPSGTMVINASSSSVDQAGLVSLPCLSNWKPGLSNLSTVISEMRAAFQRETPLFCTVAPRNQTPPIVQPPPSPRHAGGSVSHSSPEPYRQFFPDPMLPFTSTASSQNRAAFSPKSGAVSPAQTSDKAPVTDVPAVRRSHTEELLDLGITFGGTESCTLSPSNPFLQNTTVSSANTSTSEDMATLFGSLHLENANVSWLNPSDKGFPSLMGEELGDGAPPAGHQPLVDDAHKIEVNRLPPGIPPRKMRNKLTIYFQRQQNGGGEVLDVHFPATQPDQAYITFCNQRDAEQVLKQPDRLFPINQEHFPIQVKKFDGVLETRLSLTEPKPLLSRTPLHIPSSDASVPDGISRDKADMFWSLLSLKERRFSPEEVLEAVQSCRDLSSALRYLTHECPICQEQVSFSKIITMTHCSCAFCESCFKAYFSSAIKEKNISSVVCPICNQPELQGAGRLEEAMDYFSLLDTQIKHYLDKETHELFQRKLRDQALQDMPNFRWCAHCSFGVLHEAARLRMDCPNCGKSTCSQCRRPWTAQHEGVSCETFKEWELHHNPEDQAGHLENLLGRNRIDCPKCKFRFHLSKGGCLHFKCTQCHHNFCGGCGRPFVLGSACGFSVDCGARGLHAHHPRDCLYHLRDWSVSRLQRLLQCFRVSYALHPRGTDRQQGKDRRGVCPVLEYREACGLREEACGRPAPRNHAGYCTLHYKEFLVELINRDRLDPAELFDRLEMEAELRRWQVPVPAARQQESDAAYLRRLRQCVAQIGLVGDPFCVDKAGPSCSSSASSPGPRAPWGRAQGSSPGGFVTDPQLLMLLNE